jgi:FMN phosphatase YigB (HAD superfamily)|tara:strand:+ start:22 stop:546 length:525 start_codon:yes stop_codon:yes gene_type:complete
MQHFIFDLDDTIIMHHNDIHYPYIREDEWLTHYIKAVQDKGKLYVFTNGTYGHAKTILDKMKLTTYFSGIYTRDLFGEANMKPALISYLMVENNILGIKPTDDIEAQQVARQGHTMYFFDDRLENLHIAKGRFGWKTIWIHREWERISEFPYVDYSYPRIHTALDYLSKGFMRV